MNYLVFLVIFIDFLYADMTTSRIKACNLDINSKSCNFTYEPEFIMKGEYLALQKKYQACFSTIDSLKNKPQSDFWLYNPKSKRAHIYPKMKPVFLDDNDVDFFMLDIKNNIEPKISIRCAYVSYVNNKGLSITHPLSGKVLDTHKKYMFFIPNFTKKHNDEYKSIKNYTINIIFEIPQGFFKADWFFGDWE